MPPVTTSSSVRHFDENIDMTILQERARHWIGYILKEELPEDKTLSDLLADGVILERVGEKVSKLYRKKFGEPEGELRKLTSKQASNTNWGTKVHWDAMANVTSFIHVCKEVGLTDVHLCTPQDVVHQKNLRNVCLCVRTLAIRLHHIKVIDEEFEPVDKGLPPIYHTVPLDVGEGHVESVVRRIDEGIFKYPTIRAKVSADEEAEDSEYGLQSAEERGYSEHSEGLTSEGELATASPLRARVSARGNPAPLGQGVSNGDKIEQNATGEGAGSSLTGTETSQDISQSLSLASQGEVSGVEDSADSASAGALRQGATEESGGKRCPRHRRRRSIEAMELSEGSAAEEVPRKANTNTKTPAPRSKKGEIEGDLGLSQAPAPSPSDEPRRSARGLGSDAAPRRRRGRSVERPRAGAGEGSREGPLQSDDEPRHASRGLGSDAPPRRSRGRSVERPRAGAGEGGREGPPESDDEPRHVSRGASGDGPPRRRRGRSVERGGASSGAPSGAPSGAGESRAVVPQKGRSAKGGRAPLDEPSWKAQLEKLPMAVLVGGAVAATGVLGTILLLLFRPKRQYRVQKGDCLIQIAQKVGKKNWEEIYKQNPGIQDPNFIRTEALLNI